MLRSLPGVSFCLALFSLFVGGLSVDACSKSGNDSTAEQASRSKRPLPLSQLRQYNKTPQVRITEYHAFPEEESQAQKERIGKELQKELSSLMQIVVQKDLSSLEKKVNPEDGLWVDLKAHHSYKKIKKEIKEPESYLNVFFLDTAALRKKTGDPQKVAVRDILLITRRMDVEIFYEGKGEYELRLHLADAPRYNFYLNNPVFRKKQGRWYVYRMF